MITFEAALGEILNHVVVLEPTQVPIEKSVGMILREDIISGVEMPPFNRSAMDGYAVIASDVSSVPVKLKCIGLIQAGHVFKKELKRGECVKIMTGAALPEDADCVVMIEYSRSCGDRVEILKVAKKRENIFFRAEDFKKGQKVLGEGTQIWPSHIAILAAVGRKSVKVTPKPRVAILNTGGEIVPAGVKLGSNKIYNSNGPMIEALLKSDGIEPKNLGIVKDDAAELRKAAINGLKADIFLVSGGVSMGDYDFVPEVLISLGVKKVFHKVNIKPGKPLFFGMKNKSLVFGVPGNPVSNFVSYVAFIRPAIQKMIGFPRYNPGFKEGIVEKEFCTKPGRRYFALVKISKKGNRYYLLPIAGRSSADTLSLSKADGFMMIDENRSTVKKNSKIKFITWKIM